MSHHPAPARLKRRQRLFARDIETLLYSLGDGPVSLDSTNAALEDCLVEFYADVSHEALQFARSQGRQRIRLDDLPFALRNDPMKLGRLAYIREHLAKIENAKKMYDADNVLREAAYLEEEDREEGKKKRGRKKKNAGKKEGPQS